MQHIHRRPRATRQRLAHCLLLALAGITSHSATARELVGESAEVVPGDTPETWQLQAGAQLRVSGGETLSLAAEGGSSIHLDNATVRGEFPTWTEFTTVRLEDTSSLVARNSAILGKGIQLSGSATAELVNSRVHLNHAAGLDPFDERSIGIDIGMASGGAPSRVILDASEVLVDQVYPPYRGHTGVGARLSQGELFLRNGSRIHAEDIGVILFNGGGTLPMMVDVDHSTIIGGTGAAIRIATIVDTARFDIRVANGSQLQGADGRLLHVESLLPGRSGAALIRFDVDDSRLAGDIERDDTSVPLGTLDVSLRNRAQIDGRFINVGSAAIDSDSTWLLTGDSNVGHLQLGSSGRVALGDGSAFNTLLLDTFHGDGGTLLFNTVLGDDHSDSDRLVIGGDASGQANVAVRNARGAGAETERGIELIHIGGASNAQFDLVGRAVAGKYDYALVKDANGSWYLRSQLPTAPDPCEADPGLPGCAPIDPVKPVDPIDPVLPPQRLRPEVGAYLANQFAVDQLLRHSARERQSGAAEGVRGWARLDQAHSRLGAVDDQLQLRVQRSRLQLGADLGVFDEGRGRAGVMATAARSTAQSQATRYSARGLLQGGALGLYAGWNGDALYVDGSVQRGQFRNRVQGEGLAEERYDAKLWQSSLEAGYRFRLGRAPASLTPELQLVHTDRRIDTHTEANGTVVRSLGNSSLSGRVGLRLQGEGRAVSPYLLANAYREGGSQGLAFDDEAMRASVPRNRYELSAGANLQLQAGLRAWGGLGVMRGDHGYREARANLGVAYRW